jgi:TPR repeat protein
MRNLIKTLLVVLLLSVNHAAIAGDLEDSDAAAKKGDYATALRLWEPLAEQGNAEAQYNLGVLYAYGKGVVQDYKTAVKWFTLAAEQGDAKAQYNLGLIYSYGGLTRDIITAVRKYLNDEDVTQDYTAAVKWFTLAAEQGNAKAQSELGEMYAYGQGVAQDYKTAVKWYTLAAEQGNASAQYNLGVMYHKGQGVAQDYKTAVKWFTLAAEQGDAFAQSSLGVMYYGGQGVAQDYKTAFKWFTLAAEQGVASAQSSLGVMYYVGQGVAQDYKTAVKWYTLAAEQGDAIAKEILRIEAIEFDLRERNLFIRRLKAERESIEREKWTLEDARYKTGVMYAEGKGVVQDYKTAAKWFTLAAEQGISKAQSKLGAMYADGRGVAQDFVKAHMWFNIAAIDGRSEDAVSSRDKISKEMTPAQIEKAQEAANRCIKQNFKNCD